MKIVLRSLAFIYGSVVRLRNFGFDKGILPQYRGSLPVISIGNLTVGGTGKTPLVREVCRFLVEKGLRPVVISRGYGGSLKGPILVEEHHLPADVGDEPKMLQHCFGIPVVVSRKRVLGAQLVEAKNLGDIIVLDDGLQHRWLARDLDVVTIDVSSPEAIRRFAEKRLLPDGRYREPFDAAMNRAGVVVFSTRTIQITDPLTEGDLDRRDEGQEQVMSELRALLPAGVPHVFSALRADPQATAKVWQGVEQGFEQGGEPKDQATSDAAMKDVVAFCGIAQPEGFFESLRRLGFSLKATYRYPDHAKYSLHQLQELLDLYPDMPLVCTLKDWVKISPLGLEAKLGDKAKRIYPLDVAAVLSGDIIWDRILEVLRRRGVIS